MNLFIYQVGAKLKVKSEEEKNIDILVRELDPSTHFINMIVKKVIKNLEKEIFENVRGRYEKPSIFR